MTAIDPWFLSQLRRDRAISRRSWPGAIARNRDQPRADSQAKRDRHFRSLSWRARGTRPSSKCAARRKELGVSAVFNRVDTCAAEFESFTPYLYSSYESECEADPTSRKKVMILGSGPNRIGQGIEFDYCCCHASFALQDFERRIDHGQLQSGDRFDRLRHQRPPLLRAADA